MIGDKICAPCEQPIKFRELYHEVIRAAEIGSRKRAIVVEGPKVIVHVYPCPSTT